MKQGLNFVILTFANEERIQLLFIARLDFCMFYNTFWMSIRDHLLNKYFVFKLKNIIYLIVSYQFTKGHLGCPFNRAYLTNLFLGYIKCQSIV